ncbi:hypothetical protein Q8A73_000264 [Channa argus]|nr:hypothetical protein Q8A73_000264 [Channa argus]
MFRIGTLIQRGLRQKQILRRVQRSAQHIPGVSHYRLRIRNLLSSEAETRVSRDDLVSVAIICQSVKPLLNFLHGKSLWICECLGSRGDELRLACRRAGNNASPTRRS